MVRMDETNMRLLHLLQNNGRATITDLAQAVGRSESTVRERVTAMELAGIVQKYEARVDWARAGLPATAVIRARCDMARVPEVAKHLMAIPNVTRALLLTGPKPVLAVLRVRDLGHLQSILRERMPAGELSDVEAEISLETLVEQRQPLVDVPNPAPSLHDLVAPPAPPAA